MDRQQPPGYYPEQGDWAPVEGEDHEDVLPCNLFTSSQTQYLNELIDGTSSNFQPGPNHQVVNDVSFIPSGFVDDFQQDSTSCVPLMPPPDQLYHVNHAAILQDVPLSHQIHLNDSHFSNPNNEVPALETWPGPLNFNVEFSKAQDRTKATPWIFSTKLTKLYVSVDKACPINFKINVAPLDFSLYRLRGQIVYSKADDYKDIVERCLNHQKKDISPMPNTPHVMRCDDTSSSYIDHTDKRHSVLVPLKPPAPGTQSITLCFRFMCLSSCIGSLNRRPTKLIFTLETHNGEIVGRYVCDVRICSCPGRDIRSEEKKEDEKSIDPALSTNGGTDTANIVPIELPLVDSRGKTKKRKIHNSGFTNIVSQPLNPNPVVDDDDQTYNFSVNIRGRRNYELIRDLVQRLLEHTETATRNNQLSQHQNDGEKRFKKEQP